MMLATISMQQIKDFAEFDEATNELLIDGDHLKESHVGFYTVSVSARFTNGTHTEFAEGKFRLQVVSAAETSDGSLHSQSNEPENIIDLKEWDGLVELAETGSQYSPGQPVPYISSLTEFGVLTITWDKLMQDIHNITEVPPAKVMIRKDSSALESRRSRRSLQEYWLKDSSLGHTLVS